MPGKRILDELDDVALAKLAKGEVERDPQRRVRAARRRRRPAGLVENEAADLDDLTVSTAMSMNLAGETMPCSGCRHRMRASRADDVLVGELTIG